MNAHAAKILLVAGNHEEATSLLMRMRNENPGFYLTHFYLGMLDGMVCHNYHRAIESFSKAADLSNQNSAVLSALGVIYARAGQTSASETKLAILLDRQKKSYVPATDLAPVYWGLGRTDEAFECLGRAVEEKS